MTISARLTRIEQLRGHAYVFRDKPGTRDAFIASAEKFERMTDDEYDEMIEESEEYELYLMDKKR